MWKVALYISHNNVMFLAIFVLERRRVKSPATNNKEWLKLDEDVDNYLESISKDSVDQKLQTTCTIITNMGAERFSVEERQGDSKQSSTGVNPRSVSWDNS